MGGFGEDERSSDTAPVLPIYEIERREVIK
jgi:hypothetical protein